MGIKQDWKGIGNILGRQELLQDDCIRSIKQWWIVWAPVNYLDKIYNEGQNFPELIQLKHKNTEVYDWSSICWLT